jgi:hypothetical protein
VLTAEEREDFFTRKGYLLVPDALSPELVERARAAVDRLAAPVLAAAAGAPPPSVNVADILGRDDAFLELMDCPRVFPKLWGILGWNIWVQHSHIVVNPPARPAAASSPSPSGAAPPPFPYGWHRDGGAINRDVQLPAPLLVKVGFYLSDVAADGGPTYLLEGAAPDAPIPASTELPAGARPLVVKAGTAVLFGNRAIHSLRSPNTSAATRRAVFLQYGYRWIHSLDRSTVEHLAARVDPALSPVRRQLLGLTTTFTTAAYKGSEGRSGRFVPGPDDVPLFGYLKQLLGDDAGKYVARSLADDELRLSAY